MNRVKYYRQCFSSFLKTGGERRNSLRRGNLMRYLEKVFSVTSSVPLVKHCAKYTFYIPTWKLPKKSNTAVQSLSHGCLFATPWTAAHQAFPSSTISQSLLKLMSIESVMPSNYLIFCCPLLLLPSVFPSIIVFSNKPALHIRRISKVLELQLQHQSFQRTFRICFIIII